MAVTASDKLAAYNGALRRLGSRRLAGLTENRLPRRLLDDAWGDSDNAVRTILQRGEWNFALRTVEGIYSPSVEPEFGFRRAYPKPSDFVRLAGLSTEPYFKAVLTDQDFVDEADHWFTDQDVLYIKYVSDDGSYGMSSGNWDEAFKDALETHLATEIAESLTNSGGIVQKVKAEAEQALRRAKSTDAMNEGVKMWRSGSWVRSRASRLGTERG